MTALYVTLLAIIAAAFAGTFWIRRVADRRWRMHVLLQPMAEDFTRLQIVLADRLTPPLRQMGDAIAAMAPALQRFGEAMQKDKP